MSIGTQRSDDYSSKAQSTTVMMIIIVLIAVVVAVVLGVFVSNIISKPIKKLEEAADKLSTGDVNVDVKATTKDEIGKLMSSFDTMVKNIKGQAEAADRIATGDLSIKVSVKSENDILSKSLQTVIETLKMLIAETEMLSKASEEGNLSTRGDIDKFNGAYANIVNGFNTTLETVIKPVQEASAVLEEVSKGNLKVSVKGDYKGDHAIIKNALNDTVSTLSSYINEISNVLTEMANGNLNININNDYRGDFSEIKSSLNNIIKAFNDVLNDINSSALQVASGSRQVSDSASHYLKGQQSKQAPLRN